MSLFKRLRGAIEKKQSAGKAVLFAYQAGNLYKQGQYDQALAAAQQAEEHLQGAVDEDDPIYANILNTLGFLYLKTGDYARAETFLRRAVESSRSAQGEDHADYALTLGNLAQVHTLTGDYARAEDLYQQAIEIRRDAVGEDHPEYGQAVNNLAALYRLSGDYARAEELYHQAIEIERAALGENHPDYAQALGNLATLYVVMGKYDWAEDLLQQAIEIQRAALGEDDPRLTLNLNNLASLYKSTGDYVSAETFLRQAVDISRSALGEEHPDHATPLNNLAELYWMIGDYKQAELLWRQASEIVCLAQGESHPNYAAGLNNLAELYRSMDSYAEAEPLYQQAIEIQRAALGEDHPDLAGSLSNLGELYRKMGNYEQVESTHRQALEIRQAALGEEHPANAGALVNLAMFYMIIGDYGRAEPLVRQALGILRSTLGEEHPNFGRTLQTLAWLYVASDRPGEALFPAIQAAEIEDRVIGQVFSIGSERQRMAHLRSMQRNTAGFLSLISQHLAGRPDAIQAGMNLVLRRKALGAEGLAVQRDAVLSGRYQELEPQLHQLFVLRGQIAQKTLAGPGPEGLESHQQQIAEWNDQRQALEAELAHQIPEMDLAQKLHEVDCQTVAQALSDATALVEFVRFDLRNFQAVPARGDQEWGPARYLAFVLHAGMPDEAAMIDLGEAEPIEQLLAAFRGAIAGQADRRDLMSDDEVLVAASGLSAGRPLRAALFDPLLPALGGCRRIFFSPDGDLSRLPFEILPLENGCRLIDQYEFSYLSAGRDLLRLGTATSGDPARAVVLADPDFDLAAGRAPEGDGAWPARPVGRQSRDLDRASRRFGRLPGTRLEGQQVAHMLHAVELFDVEALEGQLKRHVSPRILHIATHGFFLPDQEQDADSDGGADLSRLERLASSLENPLLRSGLALAGANTWLDEGDLPAGAEDALLNGEDVSGMDLLDTELVVLSACETGLGEVQAGEGVIGLRRAFVLAGARTLVMSLWKVPDDQTQELMADFYRRILDGAPRAEALRQAQLAMKERYPNPLYWGAFICQGDPDPLAQS